MQKTADDQPKRLVISWLHVETLRCGGGECGSCASRAALAAVPPTSLMTAAEGRAHAALVYDGATCERQGFERTRRIGKTRWVVRKVVG